MNSAFSTVDWAVLLKITLVRVNTKKYAINTAQSTVEKAEFIISL
jgi:hypothetical protein